MLNSLLLLPVGAANLTEIPNAGSERDGSCDDVERGERRRLHFKDGF